MTGQPYRPALWPLSGPVRGAVEAVLDFAGRCRAALGRPDPEAALAALAARLRAPAADDPLQRLRRLDLPVERLEALPAAARRDAAQAGYADFAALMTHVRETASPVARLLLPLAAPPDPKTLGYADTLAGALYLLHRLESVAGDARRGRVYLPRAELERFRVAPEQLADSPADPAVQRLLAVQLNKTRRLLRAGAPLGRLVPGRNGLALRMLVLAADRRLALPPGDRGPAPPGLLEWLPLTARALYHGLRRS